MSEKKLLFDHYRNSMIVAGLTTTADDSLICPLCWQEKRYDELSLEHVVPRSVGGTGKTLTCRRCNNEHGSELDVHLTKFQSVADALQGKGALSTKLNVNGKQVIANLKWGEDSNDFQIVGKASNPATWAAIQDEFKAGKVSKLRFTVLCGYARNNFQSAVMRAAYLVVFKCFGYEFAKNEVVQVIRRRITDRSLANPDLGSLVVELHDCTFPYDEPHVVVPGDVNGVAFFLVIIRVRKFTTSYVGAYLPVPQARSEEFFELMEQYSHEHDGDTLTIPIEGVFT